jgi:neutral trehalase
MSYFEYTMTGELTPEYEERTKLIVERLNNGTAFYNLQKYWDDEVTPEKKNRTIVITAPMNVWVHLYDLFKGLNLSFVGYHKQRII